MHYNDGLGKNIIGYSIVYNRQKLNRVRSIKRLHRPLGGKNLMSCETLLQK